MAILNILHYPDPRLHTVAKPVAVVNERIRTLVTNMLDTMYAANGIGLAATQVNVHERVVVVDISETRDQPRVLINPEILWKNPELAWGEEGCLSVPELRDQVARAKALRLQAQDQKGQTYTLEAEGLLAICIQHEMDHLMGKVFVQYLSSIKQMRYKNRLRKEARQATQVKPTATSMAQDHSFNTAEAETVHARQL